MAEGVTIAQALRHARTYLADGDSARADAEILLAHVLQRPRSHLLAWPEHALSPAAWAMFRQLLAQRAQGVPVAYLIGRREFFGLSLKVSAAVLIPRPETELLVEAALERLPQGPCVVADLGTGSGAIALAIASARPKARVVAVDASPAALAVARANIERLGVANVELRLGDWCQGLAHVRCDMIVSNPPYIREDDPHLGQGDVRFEPTMALVGGADGLDAIRAILANASSHLQPGGWLLFEHGYDQAKAVAGLMRAAGFSNIITQHDLLGHARVTLGRLPVGQPRPSVE